MRVGMTRNAFHIVESCFISRTSEVASEYMWRAIEHISNRDVKRVDQWHIMYVHVCDLSIS